jgi:hypothetical protein
VKNSRTALQKARVKLIVLLLSCCWSLISHTGAAAQGTNQLPSGEPNATPATQQTKLTRLAPPSVLVQMNNGHGQATVVYSRKAGEAAPTLDWSEAVGNVNSIPKDKIKVEWVGQPLKMDNHETVTLSISVETRDWVDSKASYKGRIIFLWAGVRPQTEDFTITNAVAAGFSLSREKIDAVLLAGQPERVDLLVDNTGQEKITKLSFSSTDLEDPTTHRRAQFGNAQSVIVDIGPGTEGPVSFTLPHPSYAGTYTGTLNVIANDHLRKSIPLSVITRGPTFGASAWLPFVLFCITLALGYLLTTYLEQWFSLGGLERAQTLITLEQARTDIDKTLNKEIKAWEAAHAGIDLNGARLRLSGGLRELNELLQRHGRKPLNELKSEAARFATLAAAGEIFYHKVTATSAWPPAQLRPVIDDLDSIDFPTSADALETYRKDLQKVLNSHLDSKTELELAAAVATSDRLSERVTVEQLEFKIERMNTLHRLAVIIVVFITAYTTLYWNDADFGTLLDYLTVFLWALGLSATGAAILMRGNSAFKRPA